jgi:hypothetical protein
MNWEMHLTGLAPDAERDAVLARAEALAHDGERRRLVHWLRRQTSGPAAFAGV